MPLSKARDRERKRLSRLDTENRDEVVQPIPLYNPSIHRAGDRVRAYQGKRLVDTVIPELDADGNPVYD